MRFHPFHWVYDNRKSTRQKVNKWSLFVCQMGTKRAPLSDDSDALFLGTDSIAFPKKHIYKILLAFSSNLRGLVYAGMSVGMVDYRFLDLKQAHFHGFLCRHIVVVALPLDEISLFPKCLK